VRAEQGDAVVAAAVSGAAASLKAADDCARRPRRGQRRCTRSSNRDQRRRGCRRRRARRRRRRRCGRRRGALGGDAHDDGRLAHFVGVIADDGALDIDDVAVADAVVAGVVRAAEGDAEVVATASTAAASLKATDGLRCSSAPWPTTLRVWLASRRTPKRSRPASRAPQTATLL